MFLKKWNYRSQPDFLLLAIILALLLFGVIMVYSSSFVWAEYKFGDSAYYLKRQLLFAAAGVAAMLFVMFIPYHTWKKYAKLILLLCFLLLLIVLMPGIGLVRGGARSWIGIGAFSIQPSEFMKLGLIIFLASILSANQKYITSFQKGFFAMCFVNFLFLRINYAPAGPWNRHGTRTKLHGDDFCCRRPYFAFYRTGFARRSRFSAPDYCPLLIGLAVLLHF